MNIGMDGMILMGALFGVLGSWPRLPSAGGVAAAVSSAFSSACSSRCSS